MLIFFTKESEENNLSNFKYIYDKYRNLIWYLICQRVNDEALREDVMQEVLYKISKTLGRSQSEAALKGWITTITKNTAIDMSRKEQNFKRYMEVTLDEEDIINGCMGMVQELPIDAVLKRELSEELSKVIKELKPIHYEVIAMHYFMEFTPKEISERLNIPLDTVYSRLSRAKTILYSAISDSVKENYVNGGVSHE